jgi:hypothetical protein
MLKKAYRKLRLAKQYITSLVKSPSYVEDFKDIEIFCIFIGYPRSGHSLIGSLLDANPDIIFSNEINALRYVKYHFSRQQIFYLILENSHDFSKKGRAHTGYSYKVNNQWQGRYRKIRVIGDKRGSGSIKRLYYQPKLYKRMHEIIGVRIKFIHIVRNPFDNISTIYLRGRNKNFQQSIDYYFFLSDEVLKLKERVPEDDLIEMRHETFIHEPLTSLKKLTDFLGVDADQDYLNDCSKIIFKNPKNTRQNAPWTEKLTETVQKRMKHYPFLSGYSFVS